MHRCIEAPQPVRIGNTGKLIMPTQIYLTQFIPQHDKGIMIILVWANVKSHTCGVSCCSCTVETLALISTLVGIRCILGVNGNGMPKTAARGCV